MANFGFSRLAVVAPYETHWREAKSAVQAGDLLRAARTTQTLPEAIGDCTLVLGTGTLTYRQPEQPVVALPNLAPLVREELTRGGRVALIFGSEKHGLTREDLACCHRLVLIPTAPQQPSMNLGQAVAVCLYELATRLAMPIESAAAPSEPLAMAARLEMLAEVIDETMEAANYSPAVMRDANRHDLCVLLRRLTITERDARRVLGIFRRVLWKLKHR